MLEAAGELVDLGARVPELGSHGVERADEDAELILRLFRDLVVEIAGGDLTGAFGEGLDGHGDLLGEMKSEPGDGGNKKHGEEGKDEKELVLQSAKMLLFLVVREGLGLDFLEARGEVGRNGACCVEIAQVLCGWSASGNEDLPFSGPQLGAAGELLK